MEDKLLTIDDVARNLKVSEATVYRLMREGELPVIRRGRKFTRIQESDLMAFVQRYRRLASVEMSP
ncbi:MAG: helix-turn-helix domain-containing protein [Chloroflexi bacterium]|jgi:excisionase family DNA binding protein|nr:helix-turn-helix domain-containing protein [Chloroflexota bacterium]